jgi:WD40 repeat protein
MIVNTRSCSWPGRVFERQVLCLMSLVAALPVLAKPAPDRTIQRGLKLDDAAQPRTKSNRSRDESVPRLVVQSGHRGIAAITMHPTGRWLVTAGTDRTLKIWDLETESELRTLAGHTDRLDDVAISPDGKVIASVSDDSTLRFWDFASGRLLRSITITLSDGVSVPGRAIAFTREGKSVMVMTAAAGLLGFSVATGEVQLSLSMREHGAALAVSEDGNRALVGTVNGNLQSFDLQAGAAGAFFPGHGSGAINQVLLDHDGRLALSAGRDGRVVVWDIPSGRALRQLEPSKTSFDALALDARRDRVYGADRLGNLFAWQLSTGQAQVEEKPAWPDAINGVTRLALSPDGAKLYLSSSSGDLASWALDANPPHRFARVAGWSVHAALDAAKRTLLIADDSNLNAFSLDSGRFISGADISPAIPIKLAYTPKGDRMVALTTGGLAVLEVATGAVQQNAAATGASVMALSADGRHVATGGMDQVVRIFSVASGAKEGEVKLAEPVGCLALTADGAKVLAGGLQMMGSDLRLFRVSDGVPIAVFKNTAVQPPADGVVELTNGETYFGCGLAAGDTRVLASTAGGAVRVFDAASGKLAGSLVGHTSAVGAFALPGRDQVLTGGADGEVRLWDLRTFAPIRRYQGHTAAVTELFVEQEGNRFISVGDDHAVRFWKGSQEQAELTMVPVRQADLRGGPDKVGSVIVDADGYFDFDFRPALDVVHMVRGDDVIGLSQLIDVFYRPGLVEALRRGRGLTKTIDFSRAFGLPPRARLQARLSGSTIDASVDVAVRDGGATRVALYRNARLVAERNLKSGPKAQKIAFAVPALPGSNAFRAVAFSEDGIKSYSEVVAVTAPGSNATERVMYIVSVGIDDYGAALRTASRGGDDALVERGARGRFGDLEFAVADARAFAESYGRAVPRGFARAETIRLFDRDATREKILATLTRIARIADDNDAVVVFFAGHGIARPRAVGRVKAQAYYFVPSGYGTIADLEQTGLSSEDLMAALGRLAAQDVVLFLDSCQSGASNAAFSNGIIGTMRALGEDSGIQLMASASSTQNAQELARLKHGLFTYALLQALECKGDQAKSFSELAAEVEQRMGALLATPGAQSAVVLPGSRDPIFARCHRGP